jgi:hypothetical protein
MYRDKIVEEVRAVRAKIFKEAGGTLDGLFEWLQERQRRSKRRMVRLKPKPATKKPRRRVGS